jgi:cell wall-associated NlpC family hydrolase
VRPRIPLLAAALALAVPGAATLAACGTNQPTATSAQVTAVSSAPQQSAEQPVDKLQRHPTVVNPDAGVRADFDPNAGQGVSDPAKLEQPRSDAEIRRELANSGIPAGDRAALTPDGLAVAPLGAPDAVKAVIDAGNKIARLPYRYGGGHATWVDTAYDCSASISFAFAAAGLVGEPMVSGQLAQWGDAGPGRWITIFANAGHVYMYVAGLRFDTGGLTATGSRWQADPRDNSGFAERHPVGL